MECDIRIFTHGKEVDCELFHRPTGEKAVAKYCTSGYWAREQALDLLMRILRAD